VTGGAELVAIVSGSLDQGHGSRAGPAAFLACREVEPALSSRDTVDPDPEEPQSLEDLRARVDQLEAALASHAAVDQARGCLMALHRIDADAAWALLVRVSSHQNIKVRTLAEAVVALVSSPVPVATDEASSAAVRYLLPRSWHGSPLS